MDIFLSVIESLGQTLPGERGEEVTVKVELFSLRLNSCFSVINQKNILHELQRRSLRMQCIFFLPLGLLFCKSW